MLHMLSVVEIENSNKIVRRGRNKQVKMLKNDKESSNQGNKGRIKEKA